MSEVTDPLDALRPLHLPEPVSWWPPAPGWWALLLLGCLILGAAVWWWRRGRVRRAALAELRRIAAADLSAAELAGEVSSVLRRYALAIYPRTDVAGLCGEPWLRFLQERFVGETFGKPTALALVEAPFRRDPDFDRTALLMQVRRWILRNGPDAGRSGRRA